MKKACQLSAAHEQLTFAQAQELARHIVAQIDLNRSKGDAGDRNLETAMTSVLGDLVGLDPDCLRGSYDELLNRAIYWPGCLYLGADAPIRDELIARCDALLARQIASHVDLYTSTSLITALAWIGDETVQALFLRWRSNPPFADEKLTYPLQDYTLLAGWDLTPEGQRRNLYYDTSYALISLDTADAAAVPGPATVVEPFTATEAVHGASTMCPQCGQELITLFSFDLRDPLLTFLGLTGKQLRIITYNCCVRFGDLFANFDLAGRAAWSAENPLARAVFQGYEYGIEPLPARRLVLGEPRRTPHFGAIVGGAQVGGAQVGGAPQCVQNPEYKRCPRCQHRMVCVGQLETTAVARDDSGTMKALLCAQCLLAATTYDRD